MKKPKTREERVQYFQEKNARRRQRMSEWREKLGHKAALEQRKYAREMGQLLSKRCYVKNSRLSGVDVVTEVE